MRLLGNIVWFVFAGLWLFIGYAFAALLCFIFMITIRFGVAHCVSRSYGVWPFGRAVVPRDNHILQKCEPTWNAFLSDVRAFLGEDELARTDAGDIGELSDREREVLELGRQGMSNEQIAERL